MRQRNIISKNLFSLCYAPNGGYFSLGGINSTLHTTGISYTNLAESPYYKVNLLDIVLNNNEDFTINNNYFTIIDSGTTLSFLPDPLYQQVMKKVDLFCAQLDNCLGSAHKTDIGQCYKVKPGVTETDFVNSLPSFTFIFNRDLRYDWRPENYLFNNTKANDHQHTYCMGFNGWSSNEILLGSTWMHNHDIIFDVENMRVGFAEANCGNINIIPNITYVETTVITKDGPQAVTADCQKLIERYVIAIYLVLIIAVMVILGLLFGMYRMRRRQNFLWFRFEDQQRKPIYLTIENTMSEKNDLEMDKVIQELHANNM
jgi:hypothetical protein